MKIYVVTEDELDYDYEETPYLIGVKLHKAFTTKEDAEAYKSENVLDKYASIVEVELA